MPLVCAAFCVSSKASLDLQQELGLSWQGFTKNEALFCVRLSRIKLTTTYTPQEEGFFFLSGVNKKKKKKKSRAGSS